MELLFRKYFWAVHLLFLLLVTFLIARMGNAFVESAIAPAPSSGAAHAAVHSTPTVVSRPLDLAKLANLVGLPLPAPEPSVKEPSTPVVDLNAAPVKSSLRVRLLGTLLSSIPEWSIASIQDMSTQVVSTFMVHDHIQGAEVLEIERERVIILNNGRREFINNEAGEGMPMIASVAPKPTFAEPGTQVTGAGIKAIDDNNYQVPRSEIDKTLSNLNDVAMQARIVPAFKDGQSEGFKLFSIRPDSIYTKIGIQNGDVIRRINGYDLNSPEKALEVYAKLKEASRIDIEIDRNGSNIKKTYSIQ